MVMRKVGRRKRGEQRGHEESSKVVIPNGVRNPHSHHTFPAQQGFLAVLE
jgi:hypothetical protein